LQGATKQLQEVVGSGSGQGGGFAPQVGDVVSLLTMGGVHATVTPQFSPTSHSSGGKPAPQNQSTNVLLASLSLYVGKEGGEECLLIIDTESPLLFKL
jgi:hypothetical protein